MTGGAPTERGAARGASLRRRVAQYVFDRWFRQRLPELLGPSHPVIMDYPVDAAPRYGHGKPPHPLLDRLIGAQREGFTSTLEHFQGFRDRLARIPLAGSTHPGPAWRNGYFEHIDAASLYCLLASRNPRTYLEVGSGNSTAFARQAIRDFGLQTRITSIDPSPRADIDSLCDEVRREALEVAPLEPFMALGAGDILFVDNSHRVFTNSDVTVFFLDILPCLAPGVLVHLHDIFLPFDYPPAWSGRFYSEQYLFATHLLAAPERVNIILANTYISLDAELHRLADTLLPPGVRGEAWCGSSFWFEIH